MLKLDLKLKHELDEVLAHEELYWFQKLREERIQSGDKNTSYYHALTMVWRARNRVGALKTDSGLWLIEADELTSHVQDFYIGLFNIDEPCDLSCALKCMFPSLSSNDRDEIHARFFNEEIKKALFDMAPFKSPGSDGLHASFFQRMWLIIGYSVIQYASKFFETGALLEHINEMMLVLIP